jgi:GH15 family glucan-1,4-alpha-glucosidase
MSAAADSETVRAPVRIDGYAPIRDYGAIGDGSTVALVALDGSVDWLCLPLCDSRPTFGRLLDADRGGSFTLAPDAPFTASRRYLPGTNVLETMFRCDSGVVRVTDALALKDSETLPWRELTRRVEGLSGSVPMRWSLRPSELLERSFRRSEAGPVLTAGGEQLAVRAWDAGPVTVDERGAAGSFRLEQGASALVVLVAVSSPGPVPCPGRGEVERRLDATAAAWCRWIAAHTYGGRWQEAVERSLLALRLLISSSTGAIVAAPTTSLPERIGGDRNWDYRYSWVRDSSWTLAALIRLGFREQAHESLGWLLDAVHSTHPDVDPIYRLDGSVLRGEGRLDLAGYRGSRPVRVGNSAGEQLQLGGYGDLLDTARAYVLEGNELDPETGRRFAEIADHVCAIWREPDSGVWELDDRCQFTQSKIACWTALQRAIQLAEAGQLPDDRVASWTAERDEITAFVESSCWSDERSAYVQHPGSGKLDASLLLAARCGYADVDRGRLASTAAAIRRELGRGSLVYRYSGQEDEEGAFVACSFWVVEALARLGGLDEAGEAMAKTIAHANDLGLFSEQIDPSTGDFLGNFPQGLSHLALVIAATAIDEALERS